MKKKTRQGRPNRAREHEYLKFEDTDPMTRLRMSMLEVKETLEYFQLVHDECGRLKGQLGRRHKEVH